MVTKNPRRIFLTSSLAAVCFSFASAQSLADFSGTYWISNVVTSDNLRHPGTSSHQSITTVNNNFVGALTQWEFVQKGDYYHIKNVNSGMHIRPETASLESRIISVPNTWVGNWTQWDIREQSDGSYNFVNKATGMLLSPSGDGNHDIAIQVGDFEFAFDELPGGGGSTNDWLDWNLIPVGGETDDPVELAVCDSSSGLTNYRSAAPLGEGTDGDDEGGLDYFRLTFNANGFFYYSSDSGINVGFFDCDADGEVTSTGGSAEFDFSNDGSSLSFSYLGSGADKYVLGEVSPNNDLCDSVEGVSFGVSTDVVEFGADGAASFSVGATSSDEAYYSCDSGALLLHRSVDDEDPIEVDVTSNGLEIEFTLDGVDYDLYTGFIGFGG